MKGKGKMRAMPAPGDKAAAYFTIATHPKLSATAKSVCAQLVSHFNWDTGQCDPSIRTLADETQRHRATVFSAITELIEYQMIARLTHGGKFNRNSYSINWSLMGWSQKRDVDGSKNATGNGRVIATQNIKETKKEKTEGSAKESKGKPRRQWQMLYPIQGGKASTPSRSNVAQSHALQRWESELRDLLGPEYPTAVGLITSKMTDAATEREMRKRGSGASYVLEALCWGTTSPPMLRLRAGG